MKSDLRKLVNSQFAFFDDNTDYAGHIGPEQINGRGGTGTVEFTPAPGNVITLNYFDARGWSATIINATVTSTSNDICGIYVGKPNIYALGAGLTTLDTEGAPHCY
jgi:hypothetical protein